MSLCPGASNGLGRSAFRDQTPGAQARRPYACSSPFPSDLVAFAVLVNVASAAGETVIVFVRVDVYGDTAARAGSSECLANTVDLAEFSERCVGITKL
jgi:hypothetical protein